MKVASKKRRSAGPRTLTGSRDAKRLAAVVIEVLSGLRDARGGSEAMGVSLNRYYQLETRALQGLIASLEPRPRGRQQSAEDKLKESERERGRLAQELARHQALLRSAQRSLGISAVPSETKKRGKLADKPGRGKKTKGRRRTVARGLRAVAALREGASGSKPDASSPAVSSSGGTP